MSVFNRPVAPDINNYEDYVGQDPKDPPNKGMKIRHLYELIDVYSLDYFVETGTYKGQTLKVLSEHCKKAYSIEVNEDLYNDNLEKFKDYENIKLFLGDSKDVLKDILKEINESIFFWLDAHESITENPILEEIKLIKESCQDYVIVIDDLRLFGHNKNYPTREEVLSFFDEDRVHYACDAFVIKNLRKSNASNIIERLATRFNQS